MKIWKYNCPQCNQTLERIVREDQQDEQWCSCSDEPILLERQLPSVDSKIVDPLKDRQALKERSVKHTAYLKRYGVEPNAPSRISKTCTEYKNLVRVKNRNSQTMRRLQREAVEMADKPEVERLGTAGDGLQVGLGSSREVS